MGLKRLAERIYTGILNAYHESYQKARDKADEIEGNHKKWFDTNQAEKKE